MDVKEFIQKVLVTPEMCPCLMIGNYVNAFKKIYKGHIERAYNLSDVRRLVEEYDGIGSVNSGVFVAEGIGFLSDTGQNSLLKFIEESKIPIILLSYNDKVSPIIMSRMKIVVKRWKGINNLDFPRVQVALKALNEKKAGGDFTEYDEVQFMADTCPQLYSIKMQAGDPFDYMNSRMIDIMCKSKEVKK